MTKTTKIIIGSIISFILVIGLIIGFIISSKFTAEKFEQATFARDESMQNTWAMVENELKMSGFTVKNYGKVFIDSIVANAKRYENDKDGMMKWVKESANQMSPDIHKKFMDAISRAYNKKEDVQLSKISVVQEYRTYLNSSIRGAIAKSLFNYPTEKAKKIMDRIISTNETKKTWETATDESGSKDPFQ